MKQYTKTTIEFTPKKLITVIYESGKKMSDLYKVGIRNEHIMPRDFKGGILNLKEDIKKTLREPMIEKLSERISLVLKAPKSLVRLCIYEDDFEVLSSIDEL